MSIIVYYIYCVCEECVSKTKLLPNIPTSRDATFIFLTTTSARCVSRTVYLDNVNSRWHTANTNNTRICPTLNNFK